MTRFSYQLIYKKGSQMHIADPLSRCYNSIATFIFTDNCFSFTSTLADTLCSMDMSHSPDSVTSHSRFPYHVPPARVLVRFLSVSRVSLLVRIWIVDSSPDTCLSSVSPFVLSTHTLTFLAYVFLFLSRRLVYAYHYCLCFSFCSLSTRLPSRYFWTLTRY